MKSSARIEPRGGTSAELKVRFANFPRSIATLRDELEEAMASVLDRGWLVLGPEGAEFESEFSHFLDSRWAVGCASGTDAIELVLRGLGIGAGDEVVTQANTCVPTVAAIARAGATPVLCDVEPEAATMDPDSLAAAIGRRTKAVIPVHLYGQCADMQAICEVARERDVAVVEDCAQAIGATIAGRLAGTFGVAGCFSFYPTKNLGALGDGGAITTSDGELADRLRKLRTYGQEGRYRHAFPGVNSRLDELQAAVLRVKLGHVDEWNRRRREIASSYSTTLTGGRARPLAVVPLRDHSFHLYVVEVDDRETFQDSMLASGVETLVHYPLPIHHQPAYRELADGPVPLPTSERLASRIVSLPIYPELSEAEIEQVAKAAQTAAARTV